MIRVLLTGGGTGGHVYPLFAVADTLREEAGKVGAEVEIHYAGFVGKYKDEFAENGIIIHSIASGKLRRYFSLLTILDIPKFFIGLIQAWFKLYFLMPDVLFSKGGTGALPVILAGWFYRIPIVIHESDTVPGLTNAISGRFARKIAVSFETTLQYFPAQKGVYTGTPIRKELLARQQTKEAAKEELGFDPNLPLLLILGGSQGSQRINELVLKSLYVLIQETQILHQTGRENYLDISKLAQAAMIDAPHTTPVPLRYLAVPYFEKNMQSALAAADVVVSRGGSGSIFEIAAFGKPAILIPLHGSAGDHQRSNAYAFAEHGGGVVIEEPNLLPDIFVSQVRAVLKNPETLAKMSAASLSFFVPDATDKIAGEIFALL